ncbi:MAG TPA: beta-1,3-glucanase family protein [Streptosporangiaceae bacterium]|jgi:hypothetical protein
MISRRAFLGAASTAALGAAALGAASLGPRTLGRTTRLAADGGLPITVVNSTGKYGTDTIRMYIVGTDPSGAQGHVTASGAFTPCATSDNGGDGFTDYALPIDGTVALPKMSGRIYFALGDALRLKVVTDGNGAAALQYPAGWVSSDPNFGVLHDWIEFTHNDAGMFCNTTMVDMFSVPLAIKLAGAATQTTGRLADGGRDAIFADVSGAAGFGNLVVADGKRVVAPGHGIESGLFADDYYAPYIDSVWSKYAGETLTVTTGSATYTGRVTGGSFTFDGGPAAIAKPSTKDVLFCDGALAAPNDGVTGPVAAALGAAFNRSTLLTSTTQPTSDASAFYKESVTNHYAAAMHAHSQDGKAYGFAFDDVAGFASYIQDTAPASLEITLTPF